MVPAECCGGDNSRHCRDNVCQLATEQRNIGKHVSQAKQTPRHEHGTATFLEAVVVWEEGVGMTAEYAPKYTPSRAHSTKITDHEQLEMMADHAHI